MLFTLLQTKYKPRVPVLSLILLLSLSAFLIYYLPQMESVQLSSGFLIGAAFLFFHFGFAKSWIRFWLSKHTRGLRAQLILIALASLAFFPLLALLPQQGYQLNAMVRPVGANVIIGAFLFGIGMTLAGSCSSGTLKHVGQFQSKYFWVLLWMIIGGTFGAAHSDFWFSTYQFSPFSLINAFDWELALVINLALITALYFAAVKLEKNRLTQQPSSSIFEKVPITLVIGMLIIAALNVAILLNAQQPWSISWIFPKIGISLISFFELPIDWEFWNYTAQNEVSLSKSFLEDKVALSTLGFLLGVGAYQSYLSISEKTQDEKPPLEIKINPIALNLVAGLLMGYGAVIAYGCNIGALLSGIISGSLHGWIWFVSAFIATGLSVKIIRKTGLSQL